MVTAFVLLLATVSQWHVTIDHGRGKPPQSATLRLQAAEGSTLKQQTIACAIRQWVVTCPVPPGSFDAELHVEGFAPVYFWGLQVDTEHEGAAGRIHLTPGASVDGKIVDRRVPVRGVTIELRPAAALTGQSARRDALRARDATTDHSGSFVFTDVAPGDYLLTAKKEAYSAASQRVRIGAAPQHLPAIALKHFATLRVIMMPPVDYYGKPWQFVLDRPVPASRYQETVRGGTGSFAGNWTAAPLDASMYRLYVATSRGERVDSRDIAVDGDTVLPLTVEAVPVQGTVSAGDNPIAGTVAFVWKDGSRLSFRSNTKGGFTGILPHEGHWRVSVWVATANMERIIPSVPVKRSTISGEARVDLKLPGGILSGTVVDEDGHGVRAGILVFNGGAIEASARSGDDGEFRLIGLTTGPRTVDATTAGGASSGSTAVVVADTDDAHVTLTVRSMITIQGTFQDAAGNSIAGATIRFAIPGSPHFTAGTGLDGDFTLKVPRNAGAVALLFIAPGMPRKLMTIHLDPSGSDESFKITAAADPGRLTIIPGGRGSLPFITADQRFFFPLFELFLPWSAGPPMEMHGSGYSFDVDPGTYAVCDEPKMSDRCATKTAMPHTEVIFATKGDQWK